jgi:hypothetical protein
MQTKSDPTRPDLRDLQADLDESRDDLLAGRLHPIGPILAAMHARASRRIERQRAEHSQGKRLAKPG